jgi:cell division initiation protein
MITPRDIENKVFSSGLKGYRREEVDQFLDELVVEVQALIQENENLKSNIQDLRKEVENRKESESSIMKTLEQAKSLMSDISASAEKRAEAIIRNAQAEATRILNEARESVAGLNAEGERVRSRVADFKDRYRMMLRDELRKIEAGQDDFFLDHGEDFYPASLEGGDIPAESTLSAATIQSDFGSSQGAVQETYGLDPELEALFAESARETAAETVNQEAEGDAELLFQEIIADSTPSPSPMSATLHGMPADKFKSKSTPDMTKTIVIDADEMARLSRE